MSVPNGITFTQNEYMWTKRNHNCKQTRIKCPFNSVQLSTMDVRVFYFATCYLKPSRLKHRQL